MSRGHARVRAWLAMLIACGVALGASATLPASYAVSRGRPTASLAAGGCAGSSGWVSYGFAGLGKELSQITIPVCATGGITVSFHSTPAGCAAGGPCGYSGTDSWRPAGGVALQLVAYRQHDRLHYAATLLLGQDNPVVAAVTHTTTAGVTSVCRDSNNEFLGFLAPQVHADRLTVGIDSPGSPLLGTRCAGPLDVDLGAALPAASLALPVVLHGHAVLNLAGTHTFNSPAFTGQVSSDLMLRLGRPRTAPPPRPISGGGPLIRAVVERYRLQRLRGGIVVSVIGSSQPAVCGGLDACGVTGAIDVAARPTHAGDVYVAAAGPARRPYVDFLAALGHRHGNRAGLHVSGGGRPAVRGSVTAQLLAPQACADTNRLSGIDVQFQAHAGRLRVSLYPASSQASDPLRTRCPGPANGYGFQALAIATVPLSTLTHRTFTVTLHGTKFKTGPYQLTTVSTIKLTLRRTRQTTQTFRTPSFRMPSPRPR